MTKITRNTLHSMSKHAAATSEVYYGVSPGDR